MPMLVLAGPHRQGDSYETLTEERSEELSSFAEESLEPIHFGPPFAPAPEQQTKWRRWRPQLLVWTAVLMAWDGAETLAEQFASARAEVITLFGSCKRPGKTYQGFIAAMAVWGDWLLERLGEHLRQQVRALTPCWLVEGILAFAVDGTRVECPRTAANEKELKRAGRKKTGPQLSLTTLYHLGSGCPWAFRLGPGVENERTHLWTLLAALPAEAMLVADAGFIGYDLLREILASGRHVLFRAGSNVKLLRQLGYARLEQDGTVYLWPDTARRGQQPPVVLRLVVFAGGRQPVCVVTDLAETELSLTQASVLYRLRWGIEVFYRSLKQTLQRRKMRSGAPAQCKRELAWALMGLWLLSLLGVQALVGRGRNPHALSIALARRLVRQFLAGRCRRDSELRTRLTTAVKDSYERRSSKAARDWPHKKNDPPTGAPKIQVATPRQVQAAKELLAKGLAA